MKSHSEALSLFSQFKTTAENFCNNKVFILHVNNAPELIHSQMHTYCKANGITYKKTVPDSPAQNGVAEQTNLTICSMAHAMLLDANLCDFFWPFTILAASHIKQHVPYLALPTGTTPFKLWFHHHPNLSHLWPFGIKCTAHIITDHHSKFQPHGKAGCFLSYANDAKGYLIWVQNPDANGGTLKVCRDVIFHESPDIMPSLSVPNIYHPLWEDVDFPSHLNPCNEHENPPYVHPHLEYHQL